MIKQKAENNSRQLYLRLHCGGDVSEFIAKHIRSAKFERY